MENGDEMNIYLIFSILIQWCFFSKRVQMNFKDHFLKMTRLQTSYWHNVVSMLCQHCLTFTNTETTQDQGPNLLNLLNNSIIQVLIPNVAHNKYKEITSLKL